MEEILLLIIIILVLYFHWDKVSPYYNKIFGKTPNASDKALANASANSAVGQLAADTAATTTTTDSASPSTVVSSSATPAEKMQNYDSLVSKPWAENFIVAGGPSDSEVACSCDNSTGQYVNGYGADGMDYKAYAASQAIDGQVVRNHSEFIKNIRGLGPNGQFTGRTYSPDSNDSYDPIPWIGIRGRPQAVAVGNPTQEPDIDYNLYRGNRKFCF